MRPAVLFSFFEYVFLSGRNRVFLYIYIPLDAAGSNLINYLKLETMGVKMITFSVGVELKNIKKNSENTFFMYLFIYNLINENHAQIMDMLFPKKEKKKKKTKS